MSDLPFAKNPPLIYVEIDVELSLYKKMERID
jgi:hypothetical protein